MGVGCWDVEIQIPESQQECREGVWDGVVTVMAVFLWGWLFPVPGLYLSLWLAGHLADVQEDVTLPFPLCCREKDIEMFLESSRSKFIGYTLGRWVQSQPSAAPGGWPVGEASLGAAFVSTWQQGRLWLAGPWLYPWVVSAPPLGAQPCSQPDSFPPPVTPTPWWACPGPSMRASAP